MDGIILFLVNRFMKYSATYFRICVAAAIGAIWSCIVTVYPIHNIFLRAICTYILISYLMIGICANKFNIKDIIRGIIWLYIVTFIVGGLGHMLYYYTKAGYYINTIIFGDKMLVFTIVSAIILLMALSVMSNRYRLYEAKKYRVRLDVGERHLVVDAILDTGNVLRDSMLKKPVNIIEYSVIESIFNQIEDCTKVKYHMIPFSSLGCTKGCMEVIMVDVMYIYKDNKAVIIKEALVGITKQKLSTDNAYKMLLNSEIFTQN